MIINICWREAGTEEVKIIKIFKLTSPNLSSLVYVSNRPKPISDRDWRRIALKKKILLKLFDSFEWSLNEWSCRSFEQTKTGGNDSTSNIEFYGINLSLYIRPAKYRMCLNLGAEIAKLSLWFPGNPVEFNFVFVESEGATGKKRNELYFRIQQLFREGFRVSIFHKI